ncbi:MAG: diacylglycerol kinase family lipid kinase [Anaerolineae bacterium]|jgi:YegS/Rv2252/BmrU family lipid kinase|nr:diacylglycerol kinase family lipid kinase [Anaerolineae bacterium]
MSRTLIILNPYAAGGKAGKLWTEIEPILWEKLGELVVAITQRPEEVAIHLDKAYASGLTRVISIGGDGTNHALVNAIATLSEQHPDGDPIIYGILPVGTGRDWARHAGIPLDISAAATWIASATPHPTDLGLITDHDTGQREYFLNIASAGLGGEVDRRVNRAKVRRPWTFLGATIAAILRYQAQPLTIQLDGVDWFEGKALVAVIANGTTFGHGMRIAPHAKTDDGLFDVVLVKNASKLETLMTLRKVYDGSHLTHPAVKAGRARQVQITSPDGLPLDLDGEYTRARHLTFDLRAGVLQLLKN